jgi:hypothetical protein
LNKIIFAKKLIHVCVLKFEIERVQIQLILKNAASHLKQDQKFALKP